MANTSFMWRKLLFPISLIFIPILLSSEKGNALENGEAIKSHYHSVRISSLLPASACNSSAKGPYRRASLKVVNSHGPCSPHSLGKFEKPTFAQALASDQSRIYSIQARHVSNASLSHSKVNLPARLNGWEYITTIGLGTPKKDLSLTFDTGSELTWVNYKPNAIFDPSKSTTFSNITCKSPDCSKIVSATSTAPGCSYSTCTYNLYYTGEYSHGFLGKDILTLQSTRLNFLFGSTDDNKGGVTSNKNGVLGLGRGPLSILSQRERNYKKFFSYCLPTVGSSDGHLTFGKHGIRRNVKFTPFILNISQRPYYVNIFAISVGGKRLPIDPLVYKKGGTLVATGIIVSRLPPQAYNALRTAFREGMKAYQLAPPFEPFDTCYNLNDDYAHVQTPGISFNFEGNVEVDININGILVNVDASRFCLAFAANLDDRDLNVFGNLQQQTLELVFDINGGKLGFGQRGCS